MPSLMELVERVNKGELIDSASLEVYQESSNSAEKFLAHHAHAMLDLRQAQQHMMQSLEAIDYSDQKVLNQFVSVSGFLGLTDLRAGPIVKFGSSAIARREYGLGIEAIQNAVTYDLAHNGAYTADRENCQFVATQYERAAQSIGWTSPVSGDWNNKQTKIAYLSSSICDEETSGRTIQGLAKHCDTKKFKFCAYSTEVGARRDKPQFAQTTHTPSSARKGSQTIEAMKKLKMDCWLAPTDGDTVAAATELANQIARDRVDVLIVDCSQSDPIAALVCQWECCRVKINLCRKTPMYMSGIDSVLYVDQTKFDADKEFWLRRNVDSKFILEGMDLDENLGPAPQRSAYGIPESAMVLATAGADLDKTCSDEFCDAVINVLRAHPNSIYLLIGEGEMAQQKRKFESAGVGKRVGYTGKRKDMPGFLRMADLYLAEFPSSGATGVLQAMACERPVVAMRCGDSSEQCQAAALVGSEATITQRDAEAYIERVSKLLRESSYRAKLAKTMKTRVEQHFAFTQTTRHIEQLCDQLVQRSTESDAKPISRKQSSQDEREEPMAKVA